MAKQDEPEISGHAGEEVAGREQRAKALRALARTRGERGLGSLGSNPGTRSGAGETAPSRAALPLRRRSQPGRLRVVVVALCALAVVVAAGTFALVRGGILGGASTTSGSQTPTATRSTPSPTPYPTPTLGTPTALGAAPATCTPPAPTPQALPNGFKGGIGATPVWVAGFTGPQATKHIGAGELGYSRYGWLTLLFFAVEPGFTEPVAVRGTRLDDGSPLWIGVLGPGQIVNQATPLVTVVLDPKRPAIPKNESDGWAEWHAVFYIPVAGCYFLEATWPGGSWRLTFAAGQ